MSDLEKIVILGAGGFGREVYYLIDRTRFEPVGFLDPGVVRLQELPIPILGNDSMLCELQKKRDVHSCVVAVGDITKRKYIYSSVSNYDMKLPVIVSTNATVMSSDIAKGTIVYPGVVVMNDCVIGEGVLINSGATFGHNVKIDNFCNINPGVHLAGGIHIGKEAFIGMGTLVRENVSIGDRAVVGAGSLVLENIPADSLAYGRPAKPGDKRHPA